MKEMPPQPKKIETPNTRLDANVTATSEHLHHEAELLKELAEINEGNISSKNPEAKAQLLEKIKTLLYARHNTDVLLQMTMRSLK